MRSLHGLGAAIVGISVTLVACATQPHAASAPPPSPPAAPEVAVSTTPVTAAVVVRAPKHELLAVVHAEDDDVDDAPRGILVIGSDIVDACPAVSAAVAPRGEEAMQWLYSVRAIASCVGAHELQTVVLRGPTHPQALVKYVFSRVGFPESRVELTERPGQRTCAEDCSPQELRVEIGLGGAGRADVATAL